MRSVVNGSIKSLSASQIASFDATQQGGCPRKWYFKYVQGLPEPPTRSQQKGTDIHAEIERYLKTGVNTLGSTALAGLQFIPTPVSTVLVEHSLKGFSIRDIPLKGFIDAYNLSDYYIDELGQSHQQAWTEAEIIDWKTTSNLQYAKSGQALLDTVQMPIYGAYAAFQNPNLTSVRLSHVYFRTTGSAKAIKSTANISVDKLNERYQSIERIVDQMQEAAALASAEYLTPNLESCKAFGGCAFADICPRSQSQIFDLQFGKGESNMGIFDKVIRKETATNGVLPMAALKQEPLKSAPEVKKSTPSVIVDDALNAEIAKLQEEEQRGLAAFGIPVQSIVPPDARPSEGPGSYEPEPKGQERVPLISKAQGFTQPTKPAEPAKVVYQSEPINLSFEPYLKAQEVKPQEQAQIEAATPSADTLELYVGVIVRGVECQDLQVVINKALKEIEAKYTTPDIRVCDQKPLAFGGWKGVLASVVKSYDLSGRWTISGEGEIKACVIEALESQASLVVKGGY